MKHIFIVDDEKNIRDILEKYLVREGYKVTVFSDGKQVIAEMARLKPDLLVLDIMMPGIDGLELCQDIRKISEIPIIFVSARDQELDRILGLEIGGDDYLTKPFSPRELVARIKNIFKRVHLSDGKKENKIITIGEARIYPIRRYVEVNGNEMKLTTKEYELFEYLARYPKQPFTREQLIEQIWGYDYTGDLRIIDDLVKRIRKKLAEHQAVAEITTVWGYGYRLDG
ncbi:response regulator transcription factor [Fictibacillus gelatini]|uniref:response regulator transcription factor n=1 Tax=Fictibacillus gelatini TaxID=225985 RepID=UPI0003FC1D2B|nr:response regulator transcription factor [Fictibacillus gelatini]